jgi:iron complex transport system ATP-binding protein
MEKAIELIGLSTGYHSGKKSLISSENINLDFSQGTLTSIAGLNGVGKSTLLKTISGLISPLSGEARILGTDVHRSGPHENAKLVSIVLTHRIGGFNLTVRDAVAAGRLPYTNAFHKLSEDDHRAVDEAMELCRIKAYSERPLHELSDGMFQKTMIARSLAQSTPVMLLDEPTAFLDYASKHELFILLRDMAETRKKCIMVSSHDLDLALKYSSHMILMSGRSCGLFESGSVHSETIYQEITGGYRNM